VFTNWLLLFSSETSIRQPTFKKYDHDMQNCNSASCFVWYEWPPCGFTMRAISTRSLHTEATSLHLYPPALHFSEISTPSPNVSVTSLPACPTLQWHHYPLAVHCSDISTRLPHITVRSLLDLRLILCTVCPLPSLLCFCLPEVVVG
jgi:hypothetical protein